MVLSKKIWKYRVYKVKKSRLIRIQATEAKKIRVATSRRLGHPLQYSTLAYKTLKMALTMNLKYKWISSRCFQSDPTHFRHQIPTRRRKARNLGSIRSGLHFTWAGSWPTMKMRIKIIEWTQELKIGCYELLADFLVKILFIVAIKNQKLLNKINFY